MLKKTDGNYFEGEREVEKPSVAIIGAGFGGLSAAMLLSEKGYHVNVFDRLQTVGGRGSSKLQEGHIVNLFLITGAYKYCMMPNIFPF